MAAYSDGANGTPDLCNRFVVCATEDDAGVAKTLVSGSLAQQGGEARHTLTSEEMPSHNHYGFGDNLPSWPYGTNGVANQLGSQGNDNTNCLLGTTYAGGGQAHSTLPPYYAIAFIIKL